MSTAISLIGLLSILSLLIDLVHSIIDALGLCRFTKRIETEQYDIRKI